MDDDPGSLSLARNRRKVSLAGGALLVLCSTSLLFAEEGTSLPGEATTTQEFLTIFTIPAIVGLLFLMLGSAFFSAAEVAFFSLHKVRLRGFAGSESFTSRGVAALMQFPGKLLITILIGNTMLNVLISVLLPTRLEHVLESVYHLDPVWAYPLTVFISTFIIVFFGEIMPKVIAVRFSEPFAKLSVVPMLFFDKVLNPIRIFVLWFTDFLFRVTRFDDIKAAPFITYDEFFSVLSESEAHGVIEEEEGQMIQGILETGDAMLREILIPRPDVIAVEQKSTVRAALETFREHEYSRMPVFNENLDNIVGILFAKDLLRYVSRGELDRSISSIIRRVNFVPQTMTVQAFLRDAQHKRMHLAIVADEFGGTEGIVTLEDAIEEVVGDIHDVSDEPEPPQYTQLSDRVYRVDGSLPLDELSALIGVDLEDGSHETVSGFFMSHTHKIAEEGDVIEQSGVQFAVEQVTGKRVSSFLIEVLEIVPQEDAG